jgi:hypothetical protein
MSDADGCRRRAERLLVQAAAAETLAARRQFLDEALHWHNLALELAGHPHLRLNDNRDDPSAIASGG